MKLSPIDLWKSNQDASSKFTDMINSAPSRAAIAFALAEYQREVAFMEDGAAMLRGANGIVDKLLNMGENRPVRRPISFNLPQPEPVTIQHR